MRCCETQRRRCHCLRRARLLSGARDAMENVCGQRAEPDASLRQRSRVSAAIDEGRAEPFFERTDPPAERGLSDMALLGGAGKAAAVRERQEVLKPDQLEGPIQQTHGVMCIEYWTGDGFAHTVANN